MSASVSRPAPVDQSAERLDMDPDELVPGDVAEMVNARLPLRGFELFEPFASSSVS
jgi:hypothetical protein